ncbi:acetyl-CoA carboxylase beta subunit (chloroplast) [Porphyra umbilicalis]|uniref:Acetyl-coenzyme A carboxylase carboxyl transferase subunit beta n=1 Tax=Porphyra umbilicalis TaxID=2786 RepID=J7F639_PORUM|nr:acetyl-CoA carboxylase beta subunit [Porphyra umbilicalis]AFC39868.1 acetyl-CoA carboxylase beta subunit [Porphyra umbilicalis]ASN78672.1 acetyl-CoA carboxylase beta subunit [Porphyra umbilicalis]|eukprot:ASN78672.1 acetyl-CoA carboxylase beta subunit (chloroplast) [Porphyra umbilicalis]
MSLSNWPLKKANSKAYNIKSTKQITIPDGLWVKCFDCGLLMYSKVLKRNLKVCPQCSYHFQASSNERIDQLIDQGSWEPMDAHLISTDPLGFKDQKLYSQRLKDTAVKTGLQDAVQTGVGRMDGQKVYLGIMDFRFMGGSMGSVVGEKLTRLVEKATQERLPAIIICASGGARMQEGMLSLMQMAKISSALEMHKKENLLYISVLTSPTTGGVTASFAMLGDLIIAEPKALIAFAGRRVIEQTIKEDLPDNFQSSEYLFEHGFLDLIVPRTQLRSKLIQILYLHTNND